MQKVKYKWIFALEIRVRVDHQILGSDEYVLVDDKGHIVRFNINTWLMYKRRYIF
jgi:hypothetical protein